MNVHYSIDFTTGCTVGLEFITHEEKTALFIHLFFFKIGAGIW